MQWLQYTSLTGSGVVSPVGVVDPSPSAIVVLGPIVVVVQKPQVFWHSAFTVSHLFLSFLFKQVFSGSMSTHGA